MWGCGLSCRVQGDSGWLTWSRALLQGEDGDSRQVLLLLPSGGRNANIRMTPGRFCSARCVLSFRTFRFECENLVLQILFLGERAEHGDRAPHKGSQGRWAVSAGAATESP